MKRGRTSESAPVVMNKPRFLQRWLVVVAAATLLACGSESIEPVPNSRFDTLTQVVQAEMAEQGIRAAAVAVVEDGKVAYVHGFGTLAADDDTPVDGDTLFAIGSLSKSFTAIALLSALADHPSVTLGTPVQDILPEFAFPPAETQHLITLRTLLEHTSTLPRQIPASAPDPADASTRRLLTDVLPGLVADGYAQWTLPGHIWQYSNLGFDIAGLAAEEITGSSYPDLVRDRVTAPLGLERTFARAADIEAAGNFALGAPAVTPASLDDAARRPAGSAPLWSSARDMAKYLVFLLEGDDRVLSQADHAEMQSPLVSTGLCLDRNYGLGLFVSDVHFDESLYYPVDVVRHDGAVPGFHAEMDFFPKRGAGYVILTASDDALPNTWRHLDTAVLELPEEPRPDQPGDPGEWARWQGTFYEPHQYGRLILTLVGDELHVELPDLPAGSVRGVTNVCGNAFVVDTVLGASSVILTEDLAGEPNLIRVVQDGVFERVP
jgi:CubicO group peptidase (beta-lactamase class C family)